MSDYIVKNVFKSDGCPTKFEKGPFKGNSLKDVVKIVLKRLCVVKKIKGVCTLFITIQGNNAKSRPKTFKCSRKKIQNSKPVKYNIEVKTSEIPKKENVRPALVE